MSVFKYKTRGKSTPFGKPKIYFTCHPSDFWLLDEMCEAILDMHDCVIFYTEDMSAPLPEPYRTTDLGQMNLFVILVTFSLLQEHSRAMDEDYAFAEQHHIPVLPLVMQNGLDVLYAKKFGKRHYFSPYEQDMTAIGYKEKLKKFLSSVLYDDQTAQSVEKAFSARLFLSYRKKDRHYANELMRLIHKNPEHQDVAVWYDEFLIPGEAFDENIRAALTNSDLFTLLVTPNLVNEKNYVQTVEYPEAVAAKKRVLPVEMVETERSKLKEQYPGIPDCVDGYAESELCERLRVVLKGVNGSGEEDFNKDYLLGLAYLDGINVEVNKTLALEYITRAANANVPAAMKKLYYLYGEGSAVEIDYEKSLYWIKRLADYNERTLGSNHPETILSFMDLTVACLKFGDYKKAREYGEKAYNTSLEAFGENDSRTLVCIDNLASTCSMLGDYERALQLQKKAYALLRDNYGKKYVHTLIALSNAADSYYNLGDYEKALKFGKKAYLLKAETLGEKHPQTLLSLCNYASACVKNRLYGESIELASKAVDLCSKTLGDCHPQTLQAKSVLSDALCDSGDYEKAFSILSHTLRVCISALGEKHSRTLEVLCRMGSLLYAVGDYKQAAEISEKVYKLNCEVYGTEDLRTLITLCNLGNAHNGLGEHEKAFWELKKAYDSLKKNYGERHVSTLEAFFDLGYTCGELGRSEKELDIKERVYAARKEVLGENHPDTVKSLGDLAGLYGAAGNLEKAKAFQQNYCSATRALYSWTNPNTQAAHVDLIVICINLRDFERAYSVCREVWISSFKLTEELGNLVAEVFDACGEGDKAEAIRSRIVR